ncbi:thiol-disulfide oxidoreductase DCC family protein [Halobacillus seohaensis]|uniref:Thiol-disulfide oxidoreductase DCC family protein n=1 Tax=Halobacillus seohaensis TaxID=447421 RepID=A0ABW2EHK3_9BACI
MKHIVFYDAQCPFCYHVKKFLRRFDWFDQVKWVSVQEVEASGNYPYLKGENTLEEIHLLTKQGELKKGFRSIRFLLIVLPPLSLIGFALYLPGVLKVGSPLYIWFSKRRYKWFGQYDKPRY